MNDATQPRPARPLLPKVRIDQSGGSLGLSYRRRQWHGGCFLILWLIGWTVGCVFLAGLVIHEPKLFNFLFAVPFWASWLFVFAMLLNMCFQRETFSLGPAGATFSRRVLVEIKRRETPLAEIKRFNTYERVVDSESGRTESGLEMETLGLPLQFAAGLNEAELLWLQDLLAGQLADLRERFHIEPPTDDTDSDGLPDQSGDRFASDPPSDCSWRREDDFDTVTFRQSGRFSLSTVAVLLFINAFWNGGVSVFVGVLCGMTGGTPQGAMWWGLFFFMIPFEVIGLGMFAVLVMAILEPTRRTSWRIGRSDVTCRLTWLGVGPAWTYLVDSLDRIEVKSSRAEGARSGNRVTLPWKSDEAAFRLSLVDPSNQEVCSIPGLTEGESHWMADVIRDQRPMWFRS